MNLLSCPCRLGSLAHTGGTQGWVQWVRWPLQSHTRGWCTGQVLQGECTLHAKMSTWRRRGGCEGEDLKRRGRKSKSEGFQVGVEAKKQEWVGGEEAEAVAEIAIVKVFFSVSQHSYLELLTQHFYQRIFLHWGEHWGERASAFIPFPLALPKGRR